MRSQVFFYFRKVSLNYRLFGHSHCMYDETSLLIYYIYCFSQIFTIFFLLFCFLLIFFFQLISFLLWHNYLLLCSFCAVLSCSVMSDSLQPYGLQFASLLCLWGFSRQELLEYVAHALLPGIFLTQRSNPGFPALQMDSLPSEPPGKPMNTGMGSLFLLQGIFQTQESNWGFLHCRQIFLPAELPGKVLCSFQLVLSPDMLLISSNLSLLLALFCPIISFMRFFKF